MKKSFDLFTIDKDQTSFPLKLKNTYKCPKKIWCQGNKDLLNHPKSLAVVGSRQMSWYGHLAVDKLLTKELVQQLIIISGLAIGVDRLAHQICLERGGQTIAVLGSGLDQASLYPPSNWSLAQKIINSGGLLLSEYPPGEQARPYYFPQRNRIIVGLASAVLVIEAAEKSGALITAELANQEGRDVLAVPGNINQTTSKGTNQLIKSGAGLITAVDDLLGSLDLPKSNSYSEINQRLPPDQAKIIKLLRTKPATTDYLIKSTGWPANQMVSLLTEMELSGIVKQQPDKTYYCLSV